MYAVPDPVTGDQVMCAIELEPDTTFDPAAFASFLEAQPDLGPKWWPAYVRICARIPLTGSNKVDKAPLRREGWAATEPVWARIGRTNEYVPMTSERQARLESEFRSHGRAAFIARADNPPTVTG